MLEGIGDGLADGFLLKGFRDGTLDGTFDEGDAVEVGLNDFEGDAVGNFEGTIDGRKRLGCTVGFLEGDLFDDKAVGMKVVEECVKDGKKVEGRLLGVFV